jgi:hypothetical protein
MEMNYAASLEKKQAKSSSELLKIKDYAVERLLSQMIKKIREKCVLSPDYLILVLDSHTARQFSSLQIEFFNLFKH